ETLVLQRQLAIRKYSEELKQLMALLSFSTSIVKVSEELLASIAQDRKDVEEVKCTELWRNDKEPYRVKIAYMLQKLANIKNEELKGTPARYNRSEELIE